MLSLISYFQQKDIYKNIFLISAKNGDGIKDLGDALATAVPEGPYLYPPDQVADIPQRLMAAEMTREVLFLRLHNELPYNLNVQTESWSRKADGSVRIEQVVFVTRKSHKPIVLGRGGQTIKTIGSHARREMEDWLGVRVHLFLFVKVRENWTQDRSHYSETGLEYDA